MKLFYFLLLFCTTYISYGQESDNLAQAIVFEKSREVSFEENKGQIQNTKGGTASYVQYHYKSKGTDIFMLPTGIAYQFSKINYPEGYKKNVKHLTSEEAEKQEELRDKIQLETYRMDMTLVGANSNATIIAEGKSKDYVNYYNRNVLDVHSFSQLTYKDIYPGIDWVIYITDKGLKYDFIVQPGANPNQIQMRFKHHEDLKINTDGSFTVSNSMGEITEQAPVSFQGKKDVHSSFVLDGDVIRFDIGEYNSKKWLTIDPNLIWATYYGGTGDDELEGGTIDASGNIYVTGNTGSTNAIALGGHQNTLNGTSDAFLVKFDANGVRQWATYYGGANGASGLSCNTDASGNVFMAGLTSSTTNIAFNGHQNTYGGSLDAFLVKFDANGVRQWATYYGGSGTERGYSCLLDGNGDVFLVGATFSSTNIAFNGHQNTFGGRNDAFLVKFNNNGVRQWGTYYGGSEPEFFPHGAIDASGNVFIAGQTESTTNIAFNGHQNTLGGGYDGFLVKFDNNGVRQWGTYYGGTNNDSGRDCAVDANGNVFLVGSTFSTNAITFNGHQNTFMGGGTPGDAYLAKFNSNGVRQWGTYYGGTSGDYGLGCVTDASGNVFMIGATVSTTNIASGGFQNTAIGGTDAYLVEFDHNGVRQWGTYYGGTTYDVPEECMIDANGYVYLVGYTGSATNVASGGYQNTLGGGDDGFLAKFTTSTNSSCTPTTNTITSSTCGSFEYNGNTYLSSGTYTDTLTNTAGCDSIVTLNLTIGNATYNVSGITYAPLSAAAGTAVTLADDALSTNLPIGFNFNFFGNVYSDFRISSNGFITFGTSTTTSGCCSGQELPNTNQPNNLIALFWEDLRPPNGGTIRYLTTGTAPNRVLIIEFDDIEHYPSGDSVQGQIHIYESTNLIEVHVASQTATGSHTIGIENSNGTIGYAAPNRNGTAWTLSAPEAWRFAPLVSGIDVQEACNSYTWIDGNTYTSSNNTATHIIEGGATTGCDSVIQLNLILYDVFGGNGMLSEDMEGGALIPLTGYSRELSNAQFYNPNNIPAADFSALEGSVYGYGQVGGFVNSDRSIRFRTYNILAGNEMGIVMNKVNLQCNAQVNFSYAHQNYPGNVDTMQVEVSTDCGATWSTVWIKSGADLATAGSNTGIFLPPFTASDWAQDSADLSAYSNMSDVIVKFTVLSGYGNNIYLDDININSSLGTATRNVTACNSHTFNGQVYMNSGVYIDTISTVGTCDSIITLNLTINNSSTGTDVQTACDSYTWIDGNTYTSNNNTATFTLTNAAGCDSVVTLDLTINNSSTGTDVQTACDSYTWIDGNTYTSSNNTATFTLTNAVGCDSVITLDLTINNSSTGTDVQTACDSYTWIDGNTYTSNNNTATFTLTNVVGCDSVVTLDLTINNSSTGTDVQTACDSYTWIDGNTYTSNNNTATFTLTNAAGCDSVVTLDLTINNSNTGTDVQTACDSYTWIDGNTYTSSNNTATFTLTNAVGCDSVVTLDLTINNSSTGTDVQTACDSYTWIDGNTYTSNNNTATFTLTNAVGCDSVVTLDLTINNSSTGTDVQTACDSYTWIDGNTYTSNNNTATFTLTNAVGCDSVVTLDLTINNSSTGTDVQTACDSYTWIDGNTYTSSNNTATFTLTNAAGCDSVITLDLTINNSNTGTDIQTACDSYTWIDGNTYTSSNNTATFTLTNAVGCDSVVTLDLTITTIDTTVSQNGLTLTANQVGATYQWVDCNNGNAPIVGETAQSFTPIANGDYAVIVTVNNCSNTSSCMNVVVNSIPVATKKLDVRVYPNPTHGVVTIAFDQVIAGGTARLVDINGRVLLERVLDNQQAIQLNISDLPTAVYFVELQTSEGIYTKKLIKE